VLFEGGESFSVTRGARAYYTKKKKRSDFAVALEYLDGRGEEGGERKNLSPQQQGWVSAARPQGRKKV